MSKEKAPYIEPPESADCKWKKKPPKKVGWYPASTRRDPYVLRYWNGEWWSHVCGCGRTSRYAALCAKQMSGRQRDIEWRKPWW